MKRRQLIRFAQTSLFAATGTLLTSNLAATLAQSKPSGASGSLTVQWLGHMCFLFSGEGQQLLVNPFKPIGCTAGYRPPNISTNLVVISSQLLDEGYVDDLPGEPKLLFDPGIYNINKLRFQGIRVDHDREGGRRFGTNITWLWNQSGLKILHLGGAAAPLIPVGGGPKAYGPEEAKQAISVLRPRLIIPTQYRTAAADPNACDLVPVDEFLKVMTDTPVKQLGSDTATITRKDVPEQGSQIYIFKSPFSGGSANATPSSR
jgi:Beta-lactamase superfamily domain